MPQPRERRYEVQLPVQFAAGDGVARNISTSGIYFETDSPLSAGAALNFTLVLEESPAGPMRMQCEARVVRVERKDGKVGIGAQIINMKLERADAKPT